MTPADRQFLAELRTRLEVDKQRVAQIAAATEDNDQLQTLDDLHGQVSAAAWTARFVSVLALAHAQEAA